MDEKLSSEFKVLADEANKFFDGIKNKNFMQHKLKMEKSLHPREGVWMMDVTITSSYGDYTSPCSFYHPPEDWSDKEYLFKRIERCVDWATRMK